MQTHLFVFSVLVDKITNIATKVYGAKDVEYSSIAQEKIDWAIRQGFSNFFVNIAKTQFSFSGDKLLIGAPNNFTLKVTDIEKSTRAKKGSVVLKSPKTKKYDIERVFNTSSKSIFGLIDGQIGYMKSSDISILDIASTGCTYTKKNVDNVFLVSKIIDITNEKDMPKKEKVVIIEEEEKPKKEKQLTMSDFFEEFKL